MRKCKYCGSEMDLMEDDNEYLQYVCMNDNCNWTLTIASPYEGYLEEVEK